MEEAPRSEITDSPTDVTYAMTSQLCHMVSPCFLRNRQRGFANVNGRALAALAPMDTDPAIRTENCSYSPRRQCSRWLRAVRVDSMQLLHPRAGPRR